MVAVIALQYAMSPSSPALSPTVSSAHILPSCLRSPSLPGISFVITPQYVLFFPPRHVTIYHLCLFSIISLDACATFVVPRMCSFLILSFLVIHLSIRISLSSILASCRLVVAHVSAPYSIAGLSQLFCRPSPSVSLASSYRTTPHCISSSSSTLLQLVSLSPTRAISNLAIKSYHTLQVVCFTRCCMCNCPSVFSSSSPHVLRYRQCGRRLQSSLHPLRVLMYRQCARLLQFSHHPLRVLRYHQRGRHLQFSLHPLRVLMYRQRALLLQFSLHPLRVLRYRQCARLLQSSLHPLRVLRYHQRGRLLQPSLHPLRVPGTISVAASFSFLFMLCIHCSATADWLQFFYYAPFVTVFQFGWASTQISHLSLIPQLTPDTHERLDLNAFRSVPAIHESRNRWFCLMMLFFLNLFLLTNL